MNNNYCSRVGSCLLKATLVNFTHLSYQVPLNAYSFCVVPASKSMSKKMTFTFPALHQGLLGSLRYAASRRQAMMRERQRRYVLAAHIRAQDLRRLGRLQKHLLARPPPVEDFQDPAALAAWQHAGEAWVAKGWKMAHDCVSTPIQAPRKTRERQEQEAVDEEMEARAEVGVGAGEGVTEGGGAALGAGEQIKSAVPSLFATSEDEVGGWSSVLRRAIDLPGERTSLMWAWRLTDRRSERESGSYGHHLGGAWRQTELREEARASTDTSERATNSTTTTAAGGVAAKGAGVVASARQNKWRLRHVATELVIISVAEGIHRLLQTSTAKQHLRAARLNCAVGSQLVRSIVQRRFLKPVRGIYGDLMNRGPRLTDNRVVHDAEESLARMLEDYLEDTRPELDEKERRELAASLAPSIVSPAYEKEIKNKNLVKNFFTGRMLRLMLIQAQFMKREGAPQFKLMWRALAGSCSVPTDQNSPTPTIKRDPIRSLAVIGHTSFRRVTTTGHPSHTHTRPPCLLSSPSTPPFTSPKLSRPSGRSTRWSTRTSSTARSSPRCPRSCSCTSPRVSASRWYSSSAAGRFPTHAQSGRAAPSTSPIWSGCSSQATATRRRSRRQRKTPSSTPTRVW